MRASTAVAAIGAVLCVFACGRGKDADAHESRLVCLMTPMEHPSLQAALEGFQIELRNGYQGPRPSFKLYNAGGDFELVTSLLRQTVKDKCDLVFVVTTPAAQQARSEVAAKKVNVVYTAVTDPVGAGIVKSMDGDELPITGVSDRFPVEEQVDLFLEVAPSAKRAALLFNPGEQNSQVLVKRTSDRLAQKGIEFTRYPTTDTDQIRPVAIKASQEADMLIINGDNMYTEHLEVVLKVAQEAQKPLFVGDPDSVRRGAIATVGPDYRSLGVDAARKAILVLSGSDASKVPSSHPSQFEYWVNTKAARRMGTIVSPDTWRRADLWKGVSK